MEMDRKLAWKIMAMIVMAFTIGLMIGCGGMLLINRLRDYQQQDLQDRAIMLNHLAYQDRIKLGEMALVEQATQVVCALDGKDSALASQRAGESLINGLVRLSSLQDDADVRRFLGALETLAKKSPSLRRCLDEAKKRQPADARQKP